MNWSLIKYLWNQFISRYIEEYKIKNGDMKVLKKQQFEESQLSP